jgi:hypothetical protein
MINYNDTVKFKGEDGNILTGKVSEVSSDMDSYEDMKLKDGTPMYWSKKTSKYVPVKEKNIGSVFLTVTTGESFKKNNYIFFDEIL